MPDLMRERILPTPQWQGTEWKITVLFPAVERIIFYATSSTQNSGFPTFLLDAHWWSSRRGRSGLTVKLKNSVSGELRWDNTATCKASSKLHTKFQFQPHREHSLCRVQRPIFNVVQGKYTVSVWELHETHKHTLLQQLDHVVITRFQTVTDIKTKTTGQ